MAAFMLAIVVESFSSSVMLCSIMDFKGRMSDRVTLFIRQGSLRFTISSASVMSLLSIVSVTVYGFPVPSSLCLVCVCAYV